MSELMMQLPDAVSDSRSRMQHGLTAASQLLFALEELIEALDRRIPHVERVGEAEIAADASRLRACAMQRIALLRPAE